MKNVKTGYTTRTIGEAQGYLPLHVADAMTGFQPCMLTFWKPNLEELKRLNEGHFVSLTVLGSSHPPIVIEVPEMLIQEITEKVS